MANTHKTLTLHLSGLNKNVASFSGDVVEIKHIKSSYDNSVKDVDIKAATANINVGVWESMGRPNEIYIVSSVLTAEEITNG